MSNMSNISAYLLKKKVSIRKNKTDILKLNEIDHFSSNKNLLVVYKFMENQLNSFLYKYIVTIKI